MQPGVMTSHIKLQLILVYVCVYVCVCGVWGGGWWWMGVGGGCVGVGGVCGGVWVCGVGVGLGGGLGGVLGGGVGGGGGGGGGWGWGVGEAFPSHTQLQILRICELKTYALARAMCAQAFWLTGQDHHNHLPNSSRGDWAMGKWPHSFFSLCWGYTFMPQLQRWLS